MGETVVRYDGADFVVVWDSRDERTLPTIEAIYVSNRTADILPLMNQSGIDWFAAAVDANIQEEAGEALIDQWEWYLER